MKDRRISMTKPLIAGPFVAAAAALMVAAPVAAAPAAQAKVDLKPGPAKCRVNDGKLLPCKVRKSEGGGLDVETTGDEPLLALVVDNGINLFALVGEQKDRVPLIMDYSKDPKDPSCWRAADDDAVIWRLCIR